MVCYILPCMHIIGILCLVSVFAVLALIFMKIISSEKYSSLNIKETVELLYIFTFFTKHIGFIYKNIRSMTHLTFLVQTHAKLIDGFNFSICNGHFGTFSNSSKLFQ